ncbi:MAG: divergent polysaccharide deacetylase family protein, partial [Fusobacteria bacterium]
MQKKTAPRKKRVNKKNTTKKSSSKILVYIAWFLAIVALILVSLVGGYYIGISNAKKEKSQVEDNDALLKKLDAKVKHHEVKKTVTKRLKEVLQKEVPRYISAAHEIDDEALAHAPKIRKKKKNIIYNTRPKLAIIIDDVQTARQVNAIKSLHIPLTMSFLPPRPARPNSAKLASHEKFYIVHLPMEAMYFRAEEPDTLRIHDSQQKISARITQIKKEFPRVRYINNHTGSKFTANEVAMTRLISALNANHIKFIDSRTTMKTMAPKVLKKFGLKYVSRDVFLDNKMNKRYIIGQIKEAIKVAKARGHCIAIGHP